MSQPTPPSPSGYGYAPGFTPPPNNGGFGPTGGYGGYGYDPSGYDPPSVSKRLQRLLRAPGGGLGCAGRFG